jgi:hypothetical protein
VKSQYRFASHHVIFLFTFLQEVEALMLSKVKLREGIADSALRLDRISDGKKACGFSWTWISNGMEGLRGTTFVEFNDAGKIGEYHYTGLQVVS